MRLVLDTAAMIAAVRSDLGASRQLLVGALERRFTLPISVPLMFEYEAVMTRDAHLEASGLTKEASGRTKQDVSALLDAVALVAEPVRLGFLWRPQTRDADDDMVLETAVNGSAQAIVTFNVRDLALASRRFGIDVLRPKAAWIKLEGAT